MNEKENGGKTDEFSLSNLSREMEIFKLEQLNFPFVADRMIVDLSVWSGVQDVRL